MNLKEWFNQKSYWVRGGIIGFIINAIFLGSYILISITNGREIESGFEGLLLFLILLLPITVLFCLLGSLIDLKKNGRIYPLIFFIAATIAIILIVLAIGSMAGGLA